MFFFDINTMLSEIDVFVPEMKSLFETVDVNDYNQIKNIINILKIFGNITRIENKNQQ